MKQCLKCKVDVFDGVKKCGICGGIRFKRYAEYDDPEPEEIDQEVKEELDNLNPTQDQLDRHGKKMDVYSQSQQSPNITGSPISQQRRQNKITKAGIVLGEYQVSKQNGYYERQGNRPQRLSSKVCKQVTYHRSGINGEIACSICHNKTQKLKSNILSLF